MDSNRSGSTAVSASRQRFVAVSSILGLAVGLVACPAWGAPGDLDPTFGDVGRVASDLPGAAWSILAQRDGYVVGGGGILIKRNLDNARLSTFSTAGFLHRITQNGLPDAVTPQVSTSGTFVKDLAMHLDGSIWAVGSYSPESTLFTRTSSFTAFRLDNGALDTTFADGGLLRGLVGFERSEAASIVLDDAGRAVIAGAGGGGLIVVRLMPDGTRDSTFAAAGVFNSRLMDIASVGSILQVPGGFRATVNERRPTIDGGYVTACHVVALHDDGQLDTAFGRSGYASLDDIVGIGSRCEASIAQAGGGLVLGGSVNGRGFLVRLLEKGAHDSGFYAADVPANMTQATALASAVDGSLLVAGEGEFDDAGALVMRLGVDGTLDAAFGKDGVTWLDLPADFGPDPVPHDVTLLADGRAMLAGGSGNSSYYSRGFLVRLSAGNAVASPGVISMQHTRAIAPLGAKRVVVTVRRSGGSAGAASAHYATKSDPDLDHTATEGVDFVPTSGRLRWADGDSNDRHIVVSLLGARDHTVALKTLEIELSDVEGGSGLGTSATRIEVPSRPSIVRLDPASVTIDESQGTAYVNVYLDRSTTGPVSAIFAASPGTASEGSDYTFDIHSLAWGDQDSASRTLEIPIIDDGRGERSETFTVRIASVTGDAEIGAESAVTITIDDANHTVPDEEPEARPRSGGGQIDLMLLLLVGLFCVARVTRVGRTLPAVVLAGFGTVAVSEAITLILGTAGNDTLTGTLAGDTINGLGGADLMIGLSGNDTYIVNTQWDEVVEQVDEGIDTIRASSGSYSLPANVERLVLTGTKEGSGIGNGLDNRIIGNSAYNTLNGGSGKDALTGGPGSDLFRFTTKPNASNVARLTDFDVAEDLIGLHYTAFPAFTWSYGTGTLEGWRFHVGASATTASHRIVYNPVSGALLYDHDGSGPVPAVRFAILPANLALTAGNILIWSRYHI
jgi:uncharacterized delta-60 repeat protein